MTSADSSGGFLVPRCIVLDLLVVFGIGGRYLRAFVRRRRPTKWASRNLRALRGVRRVSGRLVRKAAKASRRRNR